MAYKDGKPGGFDPHKRILDMDDDGIDAVFLYPSLGLFSGAMHDPELAAAVCRAYNRWLADYCKPSPDRLFGVAMLPMQSIDLAIAECGSPARNWRVTLNPRDALGSPSGLARPAMGAGIERLAGYIPPPPPPPSPPPCSGTFRSWCSGEEGHSGAPAWPVVPWAHPASAKTTKSAAMLLRKSISSLRTARSGEPVPRHQYALGNRS
jgi:hypothetical protein